MDDKRPREEKRYEIAITVLKQDEYFELNEIVEKVEDRGDIRDNYEVALVLDYLKELRNAGLIDKVGMRIYKYRKKDAPKVNVSLDDFIKVSSVVSEIIRESNTEFTLKDVFVEAEIRGLNFERRFIHECLEKLTDTRLITRVAENKYRANIS